jgi:o-succinylbenzoate synthase
MTITVERAELLRLRLPLQHAFRTSSHSKQELEHILVRLISSDGAIGWGECASPSHPYYGPESVDTCWPMLRDRFLPMLLGQTWATPDEAMRTSRRIRGNHFARAAVDIACWDLWARSAGSSLANALGATQPAIEAGVSLGIEATVGELLDQIGRHLDEGYRRIKLKIAPGWDVAVVRSVRERYGAIMLQVDANGVYERTDLPHLLELDDFDLVMIEQPFEPADLTAHAELQAQLRTPLCLDESIDAVATVHTVLRLDAARIVNVKVSRLGGLLPARQVHDICRAAGIPVWCGGMHEFGVGRAANVALAALPGFTLPSDVSGSDKYYLEDIVEPPIRATDGQVPVPYERPGLGHDVVEDIVARYTVAREVVCAS